MVLYLLDLVLEMYTNFITHKHNSCIVPSVWTYIAASQTFT